MNDKELEKTNTDETSEIEDDTFLNDFKRERKLSDEFSSDEEKEKEENLNLNEQKKFQMKKNRNQDQGKKNFKFYSFS